MTQERLTIRKIAEVHRLKWECQQSNWAGQSPAVAPSPTAPLPRIYAAPRKPLSWPLSDDLGEDTLYELLFAKVPRPDSRAIPCPDWSLIHAELRKKIVTLRLLWVEYQEAHADGYGHSQSCALPLPRVGQVFESIDGEVQQVQIFIDVLGASNYAYAEAHESHESPNWIGAHVRMFVFFGGSSCWMGRQMACMEQKRRVGASNVQAR